MRDVKFTTKALKDLEDIWLYHSDYSSNFAEKLKNIIYNNILRIAESPLSFPKREDLTSKNYRFCIIIKYGYYIIYDETSDPINIMRIVSSRRDITSIL